MKNKWFALLGALLLQGIFCCISTEAQNISGTITCSGVGVPNVVVSDGYVVTTTDANGKYAIT